MKNVILASVAMFSALAGYEALASNANSNGVAQWNGNAAGICKVRNFTIGTVVTVGDSSAIDSSFGGGTPVTFDATGNSTDYKLSYGRPTVTVAGQAFDLAGHTVTFKSAITHRSGVSTGMVDGDVNNLPKNGKSDVVLNIRIENDQGDPMPQGQYIVTAPVSCAK